MLEDINIFSDYPDIVSSSQVREMLGIGKTTLFKLLKDKELSSIRIGINGRTHHILKSSVIAYIKRNLDNQADSQTV